MKTIILTFCISIASVTFAQQVARTIDSTGLPLSIVYTGTIRSAQTWSNAEGTHYAMLTESKEFKSKGDEDLINKEVFAYHFISKQDSIRLVWKLYDYNRDCPFDLNVSFIVPAFKVTDLDKNGIGEIWLMYRNQCTSDVSPSPTKLIMYEGTKKFAMRGEGRVQVSEKEYDGGSYTMDKNFEAAPAVFKKYAQQLWKQYKTQKWE